MNIDNYETFILFPKNYNMFLKKEIPVKEFRKMINCFLLETAIITLQSFSLKYQ